MCFDTTSVDGDGVTLRSDDRLLRIEPVLVGPGRGLGHEPEDEAAIIEYDGTETSRELR